jgi:hypothetical protein
MFHKSSAVAVLFAGAASLLPFPVLAADVSAEITNAALHAGLAAKGTTIGTVHTHLHHTVNCLVGPGGAGFDAKELNPCANNGGGAIPDSTSASTKQALQAALAKAENGLAATDVTTAQQEATAAAAVLKGIK